MSSITPIGWQVTFFRHTPFILPRLTWAYLRQSLFDKHLILESSVDSIFSILSNFWYNFCQSSLSFEIAALLTTLWTYLDRKYKSRINASFPWNLHSLPVSLDKNSWRYILSHDTYCLDSDRPSAQNFKLDKHINTNHKWLITDHSL